MTLHVCANVAFLLFAIARANANSSDTLQSEQTVFERTVTVNTNTRLGSVRVHIRELQPSNDRVLGSTYFIDVLSQSRPDTLQTIVSKQDDRFPDYSEREDDVSLPDANFDGHPDLMIHQNVQQTSCPGDLYAFYLFDTLDNKFKLDEAFSDKFGANPEFNDQEMSIKTGGVGGCVCLCYRFDTYTKIQGEFLLTKIDELEQDPDEPDRFVHTVSQLINGHMQETVREFEKP